MKKIIILSIFMSFCFAAGEKLEIDKESGLIMGKNYEIVRAHCLACHSGMLITSSRGDKNYWLSSIRYMQKNQGLWDLGEHEPIILDYLSTYYGAKASSRRDNLKTIWK